MSNSGAGAGGVAVPTIPNLFCSPPPIKDDLITDSSTLQDDTVDECLPFLTNSTNIHAHVNAHGIPHLDRARHVAFLHKQLGKLPPQFVAADPSRPWFFYWCLAALAILGENVEEYRSRLVGTVQPMQNDGGGFAGGFGQMSHLATTYATILGLVLVGGEEAYEAVDRRAMWRWLSSLKQPDGGFQMAVGGEEDVRYVGPLSSSCAGQHQWEQLYREVHLTNTPHLFRKQRGVLCSCHHLPAQPAP